MKRSLQYYQVFVCILFFVLGLQAFLKPALSYGDSHSDADVLISGENFAKFGFRESYGAPVFDRRGSYIECKSRGEFCAYVHYPPLPNWINGAFQTLGLRDLAFFRFIALGFSFLAALVLPWALAPILGASSVATSLVVILNPVFLDLADSLHQFPLNYLCLFIFIGAWLRYLQIPSVRGLIFAVLSFFVSTWTSFEYFAFIPIFAFLSLLQVKGRSWKGADWLGLIGIGFIPILTLVTRIYQQSFLFSSWQESAGVFTHAAQTRVALSWSQFLYKGQSRIIDYILPALPWVLLVGGFYKKWPLVSSKLKSDLLWSGIFFVCGLTWWVLMRQHAVVHAHTSHQFLLFFGVFFVALAQMAFEIAGQQKWRYALWPLIILTLGVNLGRAKVLSRTISINKREFEVVKTQEASLLELEKWSKTLEPNTKVFLDSRAHALAYHFRRDFRYFDEDQICKDPNNRTIVVFEDADTPAFARCSKAFSQVRRLGRFFLFAD